MNPQPDPTSPTCALREALTSEVSEGVFYDGCWHWWLDGEGSGPRTGHTPIDAPESFCYRAGSSEGDVFFHSCRVR